MRSEVLLLYFSLLQTARAAFPEDTEPITISHGNYTKQYPAFVGHKPGRNNTQRHKLDIQLIVIMNRTLYIAARDHIYTVDIETTNTDTEIFFSKKLTWKSRQADVDTCRMKGKHKDECHNFIKVVLQQNDESLFVCGTNAFNPSCRTYKMDSLDAISEEISGMARCPYDAKHANVALFADGKLYSATVTDFLAIDAVIYRSLGDSPTLRTVKHDSKWLKEPYFVQAVQYDEFIYFFFREIAMEYNSMGKVVFPRVARVCKNDRGGSQRVLEKQWTSFLKTRLNCSIPGDSHFYFNILQAVTDVIHINGRDVIMATFSTPYNSIPGSAVCAYDMNDIATAFTGRFKEQKSPDSTWTPVPEEKVPRPRPGVCASGEKFKVSNEFPDETLNFIKIHPLMDEAVPSIANRPWFLKTMVRYRLTRIAVDNAAGPHRNHTVVFLGSERGIILKFLAKMRSGFLNDSLFLEELNVYNPDKCSIDGVDDKRIISMQIDRRSHSLFVAFSSCVVKVPLSRCQRHGKCKKSCIASRDPYCGWVSDGACREITSDAKWSFEQDVEQGNTDGLGDCQSKQNPFTESCGHDKNLTNSCRHTCTHIDVMFFILYKLYILSPTPNPTPKPKDHRTLFAFLDFFKNISTVTGQSEALISECLCDVQYGEGCLCERSDSDGRFTPLLGQRRSCVCTPAGLLTTPPPAAGGPLGRGRMVKLKDPPLPADTRDLYVSQAENVGVIRETYHRDRDGMVPVTLLAIAIILAFVMGTIFSGIIVYCVCDHRRRDFNVPVRKDKDSVQSRRGSMNSVTKLTGLFETQGKDGRPEAVLTPLMHNGRLPNGRTLIKADQQPDLSGLPTPESTPLQPRRKPSRGSREWERNQNLINACTKDLVSVGSAVIPTDLPLRPSPGHIPSVVVLPLPQHQQAYQHEYVEHPRRADLSDDPETTLEYKSLKSASDDDGVPPRVPQREASLTAAVPPAVPQMGKRLDVYARAYHASSGLKKQHNTNSSNSSHMSRKHSFHVETPPPAPRRVDSMHVTSPPPVLGLARHLGLSSYGSLPHRQLKPDVPPKPSLVSLYTKVKSGDSCT
ncbi:semaphorin-6A [Triplophysa rosa]|uniref:semaphorin-6A n=1 Tax=Triplophysa rosa TaxID=992332 RepID=UPI0025461285|nr:semaphorin-6A [Triplophysa rosa]